MSTAICRTPAFSTESLFEYIWEDLLQKIKESSPDFYLRIKDYQAHDIPNLDAKMKYTIWKYMKRAKYRATPFGTFSSLSLIETAKHSTQQIKIEKQMLIHSYRDWNESTLFTENNNTLHTASTIIYSNTTIYSVNNEIRYVRTKNGAFEIATVTSFPQLSAILTLCSSKQSLSNIYSMMLCNFGMNDNETNLLLQQMLSLQLLITDRFPNIIGLDYFKRIEATTPSTETRYLISERTVIEGGLASKQLHEIPHLISLLSEILPYQQNTNLTNFKNAFLQKFEHQEMSLAIVMDPEIGIGYGQLEKLPGSKIINTLKKPSAEHTDQLDITYTKLNAFLLNSMMGNKPIKLEEFKHMSSKPTQNLPNTLSVLLHFWNETPVIQHIGGSTANAILGRFTLIGKKFEEYTKQIAEIEEKANIDILFFDVGYQAEKKIDNVNRRKKVYEQELPILTWSCLTAPLDFNDILVAVNDGQIMLRSKKHKKRLIPRIPSAYNYTRSDLASYRFLCDIQNQDIKTDLNFDLRSYFPYLNRYPRITFRKIIVAPAMWLVPKELIGSNKPASAPNMQLQILNNWLKTERIDFIFKAGDTDSTLCFDPHTPSDLDFFLMYCKQQLDEYFYITEALMADDAFVSDENGENYSAQFVINCYHEEKIYESIPEKQPAIYSTVKEERNLLPGSEWIYYELYCYPARSNKFLLDMIKSFLTLVKHDIIKWFFIRYNAPAPHIRLRIQVKELPLINLINSKLKDLLAPYVNSGEISDCCIKTYKREVDRYGWQRIGKVERFFHLDSEYALSLLATTPNDEQLYINTLYALEHIFLNTFSSLTEKLTFVKDMSARFAAEAQIGPAQFRELNHSYNQMKSGISEQPTAVPLTTILRNHKVVNGLLKGTQLEERKNLLADLIHMHINRLFSADQRLHEAILYHYLSRHLTATLGRSR